MNKAIQAARAVDDAANDTSFEAEFNHTLAMDNQRGIREASQGHKTKDLAADLAERIRMAEHDITTLEDTREVKLGLVSSKADEAITQIASQISSLMNQLEECQLRLRRHESAKVRLMAETRDHYAVEIARARTVKAACEGAAAVIAKPVE